MIETWRPVDGYSGWYEVSGHGRVWTWRTSKYMAAGPNSEGYPVVGLTDEDRNVIWHKVHNLVAAAFIGPRPPGQVVRHLDDVPTHNWWTNLEYGTYSDNRADAVRNGRKLGGFQVSERCGRGHLFVEPNLDPGQWAKRQVRACRSCARANSAVGNARRVGREIDKDITADNYYRAVMTPRLDPSWPRWTDTDK